MKIETVLSHPSDWLRGDGPHHQIVISSRVRFARNLRTRAFPGWAKKAERSQILEEIKRYAEDLRTDQAYAFLIARSSILCIPMSDIPVDYTTISAQDLLIIVTASPAG